jgi:hypothetical protein
MADSNNAIVYDMLTRMREKFGPDTILVSIIEKNLAALVANYIGTNFTRMMPAEHMCADHSPTPDIGFTTTGPLKEGMALCLHRYLAYGCLLFDDDCYSPGKPDHLSMKNKLRDQLYNYRRILRRDGKYWNEPKISLSGKRAGWNDDLATCMLFLHWVIVDQVGSGVYKIRADRHISQ